MLADESGEAWDVWCFQHCEAVAEIVPEADGVLGAGFHEPKEGIAAVAACMRTGSAGDLAARHLAANIVFRAVGVQWDVGALQHHQQFGLLSAEPRQEPVEGGEACLRGEDGVEAALKLSGATRCWRLAVGLEVRVEAPDAGADALLCSDVRRAERIELMNEAFGMDPAERVLCDPELAGAIGDDDCAVQEPLFRNRAPQRGFG